MKTKRNFVILWVLICIYMYMTVFHDRLKNKVYCSNLGSDNGGCCAL